MGATGARPSLQGAGERLRWLWHPYFAVVLVLAAVSLASADVGSARRALAVAALAAMLLVYVGYGRRLVRTRASGRPAAVFLGALLVLLGVALVGSTSAGLMLLAVCPLAFLLLPLRQAAGVAAVANLLPAAVAVSREGLTTHVRMHFLPMAVGGTVLSVGLGLWFHEVFRQSRERADLIEQLEHSRAEVARLSHEAGVSAERARLAGEIHDTLAQGFASIITLLQAAGPDVHASDAGARERLRERLDLAVRTARENLAESRALIAALAPPALDTGSLEQAVRDLVDGLAGQAPVAATYRTVGEARALPTAVEVVLLRAAQEALANARRHAGAERVEVRLEYGTDSVRLVVHDDGRGFDAGAGAAAGYGLRGVRARAVQVGADLSIDSDRDGTRIRLEVPTS